MKYISIFAVILVIWIAAIIMALSRNDTNEIFQLFVATVMCTSILFLIGFAKK